VGAGRRGGVGDGRGVVGDGAGTCRGLAGGAAHLVGRRGLFLDRTGDGGLVVADGGDHLGDPVDRRHRRLRVGLDGGDLPGDAVRGRRGLLGQILHLARDDREALPATPAALAAEPAISRMVAFICSPAAATVCTLAEASPAAADTVTARCAAVSADVVSPAPSAVICSALPDSVRAVWATTTSMS
jgi:hypothetical protein